MAAGSIKKSKPRRARVRVVVVDEFSVYCEALGAAISREDDLLFVGSGTSASEAVELVVEQEPDVALVGLGATTDDSPEHQALDLTAQIKEARPQTRVLVLTGELELNVMARAARAGACGFLAKTSTLDEICQAIRTAKDGGMFVERELVGPLVERLHSVRPIGGGARRTKLTPREQDVLMLLGEGLDVTTIARRLQITVNTSRGHVKNILSKLGCHSQLEAVVEAAHQGLLPHLPR